MIKMVFVSSSITLAVKANEFLDLLVSTKSADSTTLQTLEEFKTKMLELGFNAPFTTILLKTQKEILSNPVAEFSDQRKQKSYIYYLASFKKFTLNRVAVAYSAHKFKNAFELLGYNYLSEFLPLAGEYKLKLTDVYALEAYLHLQSLFQSKKVIIPSASKLVNFDKNYKIFSRKPSLLKNYSSRVALFCAVSLFASKKAKEELSQNVNEEILKYNSILKGFGYSEDFVPSDFLKYPKLLQQLESEGFIYKNKSNLFLSPELEASLNKRRIEKKKKTFFYSSQILLNLLFDYYLTTNYSTRINSLISFSVSPTPTKEQLEVLNELVTPDWIIKNPAEFLEEKFLFEKNKLPLNQKIFGVAFLSIKEGLKPEFLSNKYQIDLEELKKAIELIKNLEKEDSKLSMFFEGLKDKDKSTEQ